MRCIDVISYKTVNIALFVGVIGIAIAAISKNIAFIGMIAILPIVFLFLIYSLVNPIIFCSFIFIINYFIMGIGRYVSVPKPSIIMDALLLFAFILLYINAIKNKTTKTINLNCTLCIGSLIWCCYCFLEILNPTADIHAWFAAKNLIYNPLLISVIAIMAITKRVYLRTFIYIIAILSLFAVFKTLMQKYAGFDQAELHWLQTDPGGRKTHILFTGIRYFSIFTDASNMGSNMGYASFFFAVIGLYCSKNYARIGFFIVSLLCLYALFASGTRGALIVPIGGIAAYAVLTKKAKIMIMSVSFLIFIYVFFAFTNIGQGNANIRRMRTAFNPNKDASFIVRLNNQERLKAHLKGRWFGEGLGLSGQENRRFSVRLTTSIPNDSWLVRIWVETGVVGLTLYLIILFAIFLHCSYIILFKVEDKQLKGLFIAITGGTFGLTLSSYGNAFFGQYPTHYIVYVGFAIITNYKYYINQEDNKEKYLY